MQDVYVRVNRGKHRGAIGRIANSGITIDAHKICSFTTIEFSNNTKATYKHNRRPSWKMFADKSGKLAERFFKYAQRAI
jgi:hypothetical protein